MQGLNLFIKLVYEFIFELCLTLNSTKVTGKGLVPDVVFPKVKILPKVAKEEEVILPEPFAVPTPPTSTHEAAPLYLATLRFELSVTTSSEP